MIELFDDVKEVVEVSKGGAEGSRSDKSDVTESGEQAGVPSQTPSDRREISLLCLQFTADGKNVRITWE